MRILTTLNKILAHPKERLIKAIPLLSYIAITTIFFTAIGSLMISGFLPGGIIAGITLAGVGGLSPLLGILGLLFRKGARHKREKIIAEKKLIPVRSPFSEAQRKMWESDKANW